MRKVAHLITGLDVGGAEQMLLATLPPSQNQDLHHTVYCIIGHGPIGDKLEEKGIPVFYLDYKGWPSIITVTWRLLRQLRSERPDILITYLIHSDLLGRLIAPLARIRKVITFRHGALLQWEFLKYADRITSFLVTRYLTVSDTLKSKLTNELHISPDKITVVRNRINLNRFSKQSNNGHSIRNEFTISQETLIIGIIANLRKGKGHDDLLRAFSLLLKESPKNNIALLIVGGGDQEVNLKSLVSQLNLDDHVRFTGPREEIQTILNEIDIFVLPTYFEGISIALLEAMAAQKPIVATSIPENLEILTHNETALLVRPGDIRALANALLQLIEQKPLREHLSKRAYAECVQEYDISKTITEFQKTLLEL